MPGTGMGTPLHLAFSGSEALGTGAELAQKDLWVSKQKDTEVRSADPANAFEPDDPMIDFGNFIDGENNEQEDL